MHSRGDAKDWPTDKNVHQLWKLAADHDLAICPLINPEDIPAVDALCKRFPNTRVVVDHFARIGVSGKIEKERLEQLCRLAEHPHTHVKTSAFYALGESLHHESDPRMHQSQSVYKEDEKLLSLLQGSVFPQLRP